MVLLICFLMCTHSMVAVTKNRRTFNTIKIFKSCYELSYAWQGLLLQHICNHTDYTQKVFHLYVFSCVAAVKSANRNLCHISHKTLCMTWYVSSCALAAWMPLQKTAGHRSHLKSFVFLVQQLLVEWQIPSIEKITTEATS